jgi:glutamyl-tRNA reductase
MEDMRDDVADASLAEALTTGRALAKTEARHYAHEQAARRAGPVIAAIRQHVEQLCKTELSRAVAAGVVQPDDISNAAHSVAGKLLHRPTITARTAAASGNTETLLMLCDIFGVEASKLGLSIDRAIPA